MKIDLTVAAIPAFIGAMAAEYAWQRRHPVAPGTRAGDYQLADTLASLSMGVGSLLAPYAAKKVLDPVTPGVGRYGRVLLGVGATAGLLTTVGDVVVRRMRDGRLPDPQTVPAHVRSVQEELAAIRQGPARPRPSAARSGTSSARASTPAARASTPAARASTAAARSGSPASPAPGAGRGEVTGRAGEEGTAYRTVTRTRAGLAVSTVFSTALAVSTTWAAMTSGERLFRRSPLDAGTGKVALAAAILGWDAIYYWDHRLSHESRWLWAVHSVHHSSERYNLSTALRQPVAESLTMSAPYGLLALAGIRPALIEQARAVNLIYQFWIHTEAVQRIGVLEKVLNTPSHHRVHHGSNRPYLDRNHGSILIVWDKLFGTFEEEGEPVVYGLTRNIDTYSPVGIATHEWRQIVRDIAAAPTWRDRWSFLLRGPGWAYERRAELTAAPVEPAAVA